MAKKHKSVKAAAKKTVLCGKELDKVAGGAVPTAVNGQITDAVTQTNTKILGEAPAMAMGNLYQSTAHALSQAEKKQS